MAHQDINFNFRGSSTLRDQFIRKCGAEAPSTVFRRLIADFAAGRIVYSREPKSPTLRTK